MIASPGAGHLTPTSSLRNLHNVIIISLQGLQDEKENSLSVNSKYTVLPPSPPNICVKSNWRQQLFYSTLVHSKPF
jgi:hypothetical protein